MIDKIDFGKILEPIDKPHFSNFKSNNNSDANTNNKLISINKVTKYSLKDMKKLCKTYIESNHTKIIKLKKITPTIKKL